VPKIRITPGLEFAVVTAAAFGLFIVISIAHLVAPRTGLGLADAGLWRIVLYEGVMLVALGAFLRARGWTFGRISEISRWYDILIGIGMAVAVHYLYFMAWYLLADVAPHLLETAVGARSAGRSLTPAIAVLNAVVTGFYEEAFVVGYVITALKDRWGSTLALNASVVIRLLYHLHLGVAGILMIVPMGLMFGYWYTHTRRLWPLVIAHTVLGLFSLMPFVKF
jgi:uncharacterized protein